MASTPQQPSRPIQPSNPPRPPGAPAHNQPSSPPPNQPATGPQQQPKTGASKDSPSGIDPDYNTKPPNQGGGDVSAHPSPITDPTNAAPEPAQFNDENPRPPLAKPGTKDYVAGQPVDQEEYEKTERQAAERVRPEAWERVEGQGVQVDEGMKTASTGWSRDEGTRPDGKRLRDPSVADDDVNKAPGGVGGQGTRADGRARAPEESSRR